MDEAQVKNKKKSSYQRLKEENISLKADIYDILRKKDTIMGIYTIVKWETIISAHEAMWFGSPTKSKT